MMFLKFSACLVKELRFGSDRHPNKCDICSWNLMVEICLIRSYEDSLLNAAV